MCLNCWTWFCRYRPCSWYIKAAWRKDTESVSLFANLSTRIMIEHELKTSWKSVSYYYLILYLITRGVELTGSAGMKIFTYSWEILHAETQQNTTNKNAWDMWFENKWCKDLHLQIIFIVNSSVHYLISCLVHVNERKTIAQFPKAQDDIFKTYFTKT